MLRWALNNRLFGQFLSTPSGWRATSFFNGFPHIAVISIHALRVEGDFIILISSVCVNYFYPRPPGGGRRWLQGVFKTDWTISIHALRVEGDTTTIAM